MTAERYQVINYTKPYKFSANTFTSPMPITTHFDNLLQPFDSYIWISIIITILLMYSILYWTKKTKMNLLWNLLSICLRQNLSKHFEACLNIFSFLLMSVILTQCYSGAIYSLITAPIEHRIETIDELIGSQNANEIQIITKTYSVNKYAMVCIYFL